MKATHTQFTTHVAASLSQLLATLDYDRIFVLADENTTIHCLPLIHPALPDATVITIPAGDDAKSISTVMTVWQALQQGGGTRHSLLLNLGGGMVTDLGGFAAATYKRGIRFVNLPTTLLGMVDAALGGKTGVNFGGLKNEVGAFAQAEAVIFGVEFLKTLDKTHLISGFAEMLKHALLDSREMWARHIDTDLTSIDNHTLLSLIQESIAIKQRFVEKDPHEQGIRKALNLGHTIGHGIESLLLQRGKAVQHGYAVAWGLICTLYLSTRKLGFPSNQLHTTVRFIRDYFGIPAISCEDYPTLCQLVHHDKKNRGDEILATLLTDIGKPCIEQAITDNEICEALDFLRDGSA